MFRRLVFFQLIKRIAEPRRFIQVLAGPRQSGKTTLARQVLETLDCPSRYASADEPALKDSAWIEQQWELARLAAAGPGSRAVLVLDEIQKLPGWSETVKRLWDEDSVAGRSLPIILLGSSPLLVQKGLSESLAGRFELIPVTHWSFAEMQAAFGFDLTQYLFFGGYPGAAGLIADQDRWRGYIANALIETTLSRDILLMSRIDKPALLRRLFDLGCRHSGQVVSYTKMLGQLQDTGNTTTLAHYLQLLQGAGLVAGLDKYSGNAVRQRASSPKLLALNTALMAAGRGLSLDQARQDRVFWGRLVETAVGASLVNQAQGRPIGVYYWAGRNREVDFVLNRAGSLTAIEVKSGAAKTALPGMAAFAGQFEVKRKLLVGGQGMDLEEFLTIPIDSLL